MPKKIDRLEFWVRFVCGLLFGLLLGFYFALEHLGSLVPPLGIILSMGLGSGLAGVRYGDRFWARALDFLRPGLGHKGVCVLISTELTS